MSIPLPFGGFEWYKSSVEDMYKEGVYGYLVECDMEYQNDLHNEYNDLPFMPERVTINRMEKLVPTLFHKSKCICNLDMLRQAEDHGLIVMNYGRILNLIKAVGWNHT